jgi:biopolymer transport protein ExbB/TolQ
MQISLIELWHNMGLPVRCVVVLLTMQAVACMAVVLDRIVLLARSSARARKFALSVASAMEAGAYKSALADAAASKNNHFASYLELGLRTFLRRQGAGDNATRAAELVRRALERKGDAISRDLNRGMNILASTGSTAPFVGLLGTVLGIINAFKLIALTGSGGLGSIGSAISEALCVTGYGLVVAIPSVLLFNFLSSRIASYEATLLNAGGELVDRLELGADPSVDSQNDHPEQSRTLPQMPAPPHPAQPQFAEPARGPSSGRVR